MKNIIEFLKQVDIEDLLGFPALAINIALLWLLAYGGGLS